MQKQYVKTPSLFRVDDKFNDDRFMKVRIAVMHSGENRNKSSFSTKVIRDAKDSFANIAVLANVVEYIDDDGNSVLDYGSHDMHIEDDIMHDGKQKIIYDEHVVGIVPETNNFEIVKDKESGKDFVYVDALLYREYGNYVTDILESRGGIASVSAEIYCDEVSIDASSQIMEVGKMRMSGITLLGEDVTPAMKGANISMFSIKEDDRNTQLIKIMQELKESLDNYTAVISETFREGGETGVNKFEELLEKYGKTAEDITIDYEGLTDEELEAKFAELFDDTDTDESESESEDNGDEEELGEFEEAEEEELETEKVQMSVTYNGKTVNMSISLQDKIEALYRLVNDTYADDETWYDVIVYDEDRYVIMIDYMSGRGYKQAFKVKGDSYTLSGDRTEVFSRWLTQDEISKLERMKTTYEEISEKLSKYEDEPKKMEILNSEDYSLIADNDEFKELCKQENHFDLSVDEVSKRADEIITSAAKSHKFSFADEKKSEGYKPFPEPKKKKAKRFGSLFDGIM